LLTILSIVGETVQILVAKTVLFSIHKNVLLRSPFFANALKPEWASMREGRPIDLEDTDSETFAAYGQWLYSHQLNPALMEIAKSDWAKAYVLGETLMDLEYQDAVLSALITRCRAEKLFPTGAQIEIVYAGTTQGSPMRKLLVDFFCWAGGEHWAHTGAELPTDFTTSVLGELMGKRRIPQGEKPWVRTPSVYMVGNKKEV
jgi:hypothetical protein